MDLLLTLFMELGVVKSFIIPTGSMAPTLLGLHQRVVCPRCAWEVRVNASWEQDGRKITACTCTQCWRRIEFRDAAAPRSRGGDRFIMMRLGSSYRRFDLAVFRHPRSEPRENVLYVQRVAGLPGETLALYQGDLYRTDLLKFDDAKVPAEDLWMRDYLHEDDPRAKELFARGKFTIVRKPAELMLTLRNLVHDQDHAAKEPSPRWAGARGSAWQPAGTHGFQIKPAGAAVDWLHYHHMRPGNDGKARQSLVTDFLSYNSYALAEFDHTTEENWVGDLMVECEVDIANARGELWLELGRGAERIQARLQLASGEAALIRSGAAPRELARKAIGAKLTGKHRLRFANFDQRATLWIDDELPFGDGVAHARPSKPGPTSADLEPVRIGSAGASVRIHRLKLWRDVYWSLRPARADHDARDDRRVEWFDPATWDALRDARSRFAFVQPGHYFMLGDNPMYCSDSRDWGVAPVPALRGRPLLRYWPPERIGQLR